MSNKYSPMTNPALNRAVAEKLGWTTIGLSSCSFSETRWCGHPPGKDPAQYAPLTTLPDFCGDLNATMQLIEVAGISLVRSVDGWYAIRPDDILHSDLSSEITLCFDAKLSPVLNGDPKRSATECFMLWRDAQKEKA